MRHFQQVRLREAPINRVPQFWVLACHSFVDASLGAGYCFRSCARLIPSDRRNYADEGHSRGEALSHDGEMRYKICRALQSGVLSTPNSGIFPARPLWRIEWPAYR